jgi:copper transport protein
MNHWLGRLVSAVMVAAVALMAPVAAAAHSALLRSDPADGAVMEQSPDEVVLEFSEPPDQDLSRVGLFDGDGEPVDHGQLTADSDDASVLRVSVPQLDDGVYTVSWQALSAVDGHLTTGAFAFVIGEASGDDIAPAPIDLDTRDGPALTGVIGRWLLYCGLALLLGWAISTLVVFRALLPAPRWVPIGCWLLAVAGLALITLTEAASVDASVGQMLASSAGARLVRIAVVLAALGVLAGLATWRPRTSTIGLTAALTAAVMFSHVAAGHAGAPGPAQWINLSTQWVHFVAIGAWIGGLVWLLAGTRGDRASDDVAPIGRFSRLATACISVVILAGVIRGVNEVGSFDALFSTDYGRTLLVKLGLVALLASLGALNRFWNVPAIMGGRAHVSRLRRTVRGEVVFAAAVLGVVGVLASTPPPADMAAHEQMDPSEEAGAIEVTASDFATTVRVTLRIDPGVVGENHFAVRIADYDTDETIDAVRVALRFTIPDQPDLGPSMLELQPTESGTWEGSGTAIAQPARWQATAIIAFSSDGVEVPLEFDVGAPGDTGSPTPHMDG